MRELGFLVADKNMQACVRGLLQRRGWHRSVGCRPFEFDSATPGDVHVAAGQHDPGLFTRGDELLGPFAGRYRRMVVMVDATWEGSPGGEAIRRRVTGHLKKAGWPPEEGLALVVEPEIDIWLWTRTNSTAKALGWQGWSMLEARIAEKGWWPEGQAKPPRPKEAAEWALREKRKPRSSRVYQQVAASVGLRHCTDAAFVQLCEALRRWFPAEGT